MYTFVHGQAYTPGKASLELPPPAPIPGDTLTADDLAEGEVGGL